MKVTDAVFHFENSFDAILGQRIMQYLERPETNLKNMEIGLGHDSKETNTSIRNVLGKSIYIDKENMTDSILFLNICNALYPIFLKYRQKFFPEFQNTFGLRSINQIDLLKYGPGGKYETHIDESSLERIREFTMIANLNQGYKGGEFCFFNPINNEKILKIELKANSVLIFPSCFLYPHRVNPITEGKRYSIVSWL